MEKVQICFPVVWNGLIQERTKDKNQTINFNTVTHLNLDYLNQTAVIQIKNISLDQQ